MTKFQKTPHAIGRRPRTMCDVASTAKAQQDTFDAALREFLDSFYLTQDAAARSAALNNRPEPVGPVHDAYLAAAAEQLARQFDLPIPRWTEDADRFLHRPFFSGGLESLMATLIVESPAAFRRRLIFVSRDALSRPTEPCRIG